jgi:PKD repeat protein
MAGMFALASACTMKDQDAPPLTGPSEFSQSIAVSVSPDVLPQDGASQSFITVTARDANSQPVRNVTMRTETRVGGTPVDFGTLSARSVVTGSDGKATLVYTAPPSPAVSPDHFLVVDIVVTPHGSDFNNASQRSAAIRLVPQGTVIPPGDMVPAFTINPSTPSEGQTILFDASTSQGSIVRYEWNFGDGNRDSGRTADHSYALPGTYVVTLTVVDDYGRSASRSQTITVSTASSVLTASFVASPGSQIPGGTVFFNASASVAGPNRSIVSYAWDFGDGTSGSGLQVSHRYPVAGVYKVTLVVTDDLGRRAVTDNDVTIEVPSDDERPGGRTAPSGMEPTPDFSFGPSSPRVGQPVSFNGSASKADREAIVSHWWSFGDGTMDDGPVPPPKTYSSPGNYSVTLTVVDGAGKTKSLTKTLTVVQ